MSAEEVDRGNEPQPHDVPNSATPTEAKPVTGEVIGQFKCEQCDETIPLNAKLKSQERYDGHTFCFKHQLEYKRAQLQAKGTKQEAA